jgi:hypothetical protein
MSRAVTGDGTALAVGVIGSGAGRVAAREEATLLTVASIIEDGTKEVSSEEAIICLVSVSTSEKIYLSDAALLISHIPRAFAAIVRRVILEEGSTSRGPIGGQFNDHGLEENGENNGAAKRLLEGNIGHWHRRAVLRVVGQRQKKVGRL